MSMRRLDRKAWAFALVCTLLAMPTSAVAAPSGLADLLAEADRLFARREAMANVQQSIDMLEAWLKDAPHEYEALWRLAPLTNG